ncbi:MAG TPA: family 10 glycosylhydrolase [Gemmatimonadaceae bacterium]
MRSSVSGSSLAFALALALPLTAQLPKPHRVPAVAPSLGVPCSDADASCIAPDLRREFRGVWVASVSNIDWPSKPGLPTADQKSELLAILDRAQAVHLNAVILQVRPAADALYKSSIEPWSEYLTGRQGRAPVPAWDPLAYAVEQAHRRGLELHAWFNPYRARHPSAKGTLSRRHIANTSPALVKKYGTHLWMDPGESAVRARTVRVVLDVVKRYDIDGVHLDDYFYPYKEKTTRGTTDFPDDRSWKKYLKAKGKLSRDDWRRENVNTLVHQLNDKIHLAKPWVKFGISPFGIWRPGYPEQIRGFDAYEQLYADSKLWWEKGWVDYLTPQLYWNIGKAEQSFPVLLRWWGEQNAMGRHLWPGLYTSRVKEATPAGNGMNSNNPWVAGEIVAQVDSARANPNATGAVHFSMKAFLTDQGGVASRLANGVYGDVALVPASPWLASSVPPVPTVRVKKNAATGGLIVALAMPRKQVARWFLLQTRTNGMWGSRLIAACTCDEELAPNGEGLLPDRLVVTAINRADVASGAVRLSLVP